MAVLPAVKRRPADQASADRFRLARLALARMEARITGPAEPVERKPE